jgi:hypothetical protein
MSVLLEERMAGQTLSKKLGFATLIIYFPDGGDIRQDNAEQWSDV